MKTDLAVAGTDIDHAHARFDIRELKHGIDPCLVRSDIRRRMKKENRNKGVDRIDSDDEDEEDEEES